MKAARSIRPTAKDAPDRVPGALKEAGTVLAGWSRLSGGSRGRERPADGLRRLVSLPAPRLLLARRSGGSGLLLDVCRCWFQGETFMSHDVALGRGHQDLPDF